ncbi:MAG: hypothetical protein MJA83_07615 [Gammaproteobacteria bacterium]|nr:hypothetical protein [Gammaproteobacteria bacterium]
MTDTDPLGYTPFSPVANYEDNNEQPGGVRRGSFYIEGSLAADLVVGPNTMFGATGGSGEASTVKKQGRVKRVLILAESETDAALLRLTDSHDAAAITNKRHIEIGLTCSSAGVTGAHGDFLAPSAGNLDVEFAFDEGLVVEVINGDQARVLLIIDQVRLKRPSG